MTDKDSIDGEIEELKEQKRRERAATHFEVVGSEDTGDEPAGAADDNPESISFTVQQVGPKDVGVEGFVETLAGLDPDGRRRALHRISERERSMLVDAGYDVDALVEGDSP